MNRTEFSFRLTFLLLALPAAVWAAVEDNAPKQIEIPVIIPMTGSGAEQGEWVRNGLELARAEVLSRDKVDVKFLFEDSRGDPKTGVSAYRRLKAQHEFPLVITWGSGVALALTPLVNTDKVVQMGVATGTPLYSTPDDYTFRNYTPATLEAEHVARAILNEIQIKNLLMLSIENDYGVGVATTFSEAFTKAGGNIVSHETFLPQEADYKPLLLRLRKFSADALYLVSYPEEGALILRQAKELQLPWKIIGSAAILGGKEFANLAAQGVENMMVIIACPVIYQSQDERAAEFSAKYKARFGDEPDARHYIVIKSFDALNLLGPILAECGQKSDCIKDRLYTMPEYQGVGGKIKFDSNGDTAGVFYTQIFKNGHFVKYEK